MRKCIHFSVIIKDNLNHTYLDSNAFTVPEQLMRTLLQISERSGQSLSVIDSIYYINKEIVCTVSNHVHRICEEDTEGCGGWIS
jgi:hypothetical protein